MILNQKWIKQLLSFIIYTARVVEGKRPARFKCCSSLGYGKFFIFPECSKFQTISTYNFFKIVKAIIIYHNVALVDFRRKMILKQINDSG